MQRPRGKGLAPARRRHMNESQAEKVAEKIYDVSPEWRRRAYADEAKYREMYARSVADPNGFWGEEGKRIHWFKPYTKVKNTSFAPHNVSIKWFEDGTTNVAYNCLDRHLAKHGDRVAIIWEGDDPKDDARITYRELHAEVCRLANVLKSRGVKKGDRVTIYLPMIPEAMAAMLACARIGAIHSVVFGGFSPDSLAGRLEDTKSPVIITADEGRRGGRARRRSDVHDRGAPHRRAREHEVGPRCLLRRGGAAGLDRLPVRRDERRRPAVHPLYVGLDRQAEGRAAHHGRLSRVRGDDTPVRVRLSRGRHLLVHRRRGLGHRPQLHRLWSARQRRHHADVRGRAELSVDVAVLGGGGQT